MRGPLPRHNLLCIHQQLLQIVKDMRDLHFSFFPPALVLRAISIQLQSSRVQLFTVLSTHSPEKYFTSGRGNVTWSPATSPTSVLHYDGKDGLTEQESGPRATPGRDYNS
jgi:hypothetical protein